MKIMMTENNKHSWCANPYLNLSVHPKGEVKPCCMSLNIFKTDDGKEKLHEASVLKFWNSKDRKKMIADLNNGIQIPACERCWDEEAAGKESKRIRDNRNYENVELSEDMLPIVLDLAMGNLCNIKCRICSPTHSTPWAAEEKKLRPTIVFSNENKSFDYENDYFWEDILKLLVNVKKYDFAGGEPFFIEKHWNIVKEAVKNGYSKNQHIHYNTNGTIFPEDHIHLFEEFNFVDIQISSDGVEKKFEYLRHPAKWDKVENNIQRFIDTKNQSKTDWLLSICISISAFNVYDMFETYEHYASKGIGIYINLVHDDRGTRVLPLEIRKKIIDRLMSFESKYMPLQWKKDRDMVCKHLESASYNSVPWKMFLDEIQMRDEFRKESFPETFPEFYSLIKEWEKDNVER
jgi:MoaA/NifB/PqqE/SkfB family radical SAM enzyme